jgi:hypothetical protein
MSEQKNYSFAQLLCELSGTCQTDVYRVAIPGRKFVGTSGRNTWNAVWWARNQNFHCMRGPLHWSPSPNWYAHQVKIIAYRECVFTTAVPITKQFGGGGDSGENVIREMMSQATMTHPSTLRRNAAAWPPRVRLCSSATGKNVAHLKRNESDWLRYDDIPVAVKCASVSRWACRNKEDAKIRRTCGWNWTLWWGEKNCSDCCL